MSNIQNPTFGAIKGTTQVTLDFEAMARQVREKYNNKGVTKVEIVPLAKNNGKQNKSWFSSFYDPESGITWGYPMEQRIDGTYKFKKVVIKGKRTFDLTQTSDMIDFILIKESPFVEGGLLRKCQPHIAVKYKLQDSLSVSEEYNDLKDMKYELDTHVRSLNDDELKNYGYLFKMNIEENSAPIIRRKLYEKIEKEPKVFKEFVDNKLYTQAMIVLRKAQERGLVIFTVGQGFVMDKTIFLGSNEPDAAKLLIKRSDYMSDLATRCNQQPTFNKFNNQKLPEKSKNSLVPKALQVKKTDEPVNNVKAPVREKVVAEVTLGENRPEQEGVSIHTAKVKDNYDHFDDGQDKDTKFPEGTEQDLLNPLAKIESNIFEEEPAMVTVTEEKAENVRLSPVAAKAKKKKAE